MTRPSFITIALLPLLLCALPPAFDTAAEEAFDHDKERTTLWSWLAGEHAEIGKDLANGDLFADARPQLQKAFFFVPEHESAHKSMGHKKRQDGTWDMAGEIPAENKSSGDKADQLRDKAKKKDTVLVKKAVEKLAAFARRCEAAGQPDNARYAWGVLAAVYDENHAAANENRGLVRTDGLWTPGFFNAAREAGKKYLAEAPEGDKLEGEDEQGKEAGIVLHRRQVEDFMARSSISDERAVRLLRVGIAATKVTRDALGSPDGRPFNGQQPKITGLGKHADYLTWCDKFTSGDDKQKELAKKLTGTAEKGGYFIFDHRADGGDDMCANWVGRVTLNYWRGDGKSAPWITVGFAYLSSSRVLNTTSTQLYTIDRSRRTRSRSASTPDLDKDGFSPHAMRQLVKDMVVAGDDPPFKVLAITSLNDMNQTHAAKAFSLLEYLTAEHREKTAVWLKMPSAGHPRDEITRIQETLGLSSDALDAAWRRWVIMNY